MKVYGHRGAPCIAFENTLTSFEAACKLGCHAVECDVHFTADKKLVIMHTDYEMREMWGKNAVIEEITLEEMKSLRLSEKYSDLKNEQIPTLNELYELMKKYPGVDMNVELKTQDDEFYDMVVKTTAHYKMNDRVIYSASDPHTLKWFGKHHPDIPFSLSPVTYEDADYARGFQYNCNCVVVQPYFKVVDADYIKNAHAANLHVTPWTVDDPQEVKRLISIGADGVISNNPAMVLEILKNNQENNMKVYGHRGAPTLAPENTLESYKAAFETSCHGIELDVHLTSDGKVAVMHNFNTEQACGKHLVIRESTMAQLKELDVVYDFGDKFKGLKIPTLEEVYEFMKDYPEKDVIVETKGDEIGAPLLERVVEITRKYRMTHRVIFSTARGSTFKWFNENHPDLPVSMLPQDYDDADITNALNCSAAVVVSPFYEVVDEAYVKKSRGYNLSVVPWTVNDAQTARRLAGLGVDGIITNYPALIMEELKK